MAARLSNPILEHAEPELLPEIRRAPGHDSYAAIRVFNFRSFITGNILATIGAQMMGVAIGWELYQTTHSPTILGLAGFCQVVPFLILALPAGQLVDHFSRRTIILWDQLLFAFSAAMLGLVSLYQGDIPDFMVIRQANALLGRLAAFFHETQYHFTSPHVPIMLALLFLNGVIRSVNQPAKQAFLPQLVPPRLFPNAVAWNAMTFESSAMLGPMLAGILIAAILWQNPASLWAYAAVYFATALCQLAQVLFVLPIRVKSPGHTREPISRKSLLAGMRFVWSTKIIIATVTLDLFGVLLGGATALLPMFANDILQCGPAGLGCLRAAPSIGAVSVALLMAHRRPIQRAGRALLLAVAGFGAATVCFGLSHNFYLSLSLLFLVGVCDNISVIIRHTLVQVLTPDKMRGRVSAIKSAFSSTSNGFGSLESGLTAALFGPVISVVGGGIGTILVVVAVATLWPQIRRFGTLHDARPVEDTQETVALPGEAPEL